MRLRFVVLITLALALGIMATAAVAVLAVEALITQVERSELADARREFEDLVDRRAQRNLTLALDLAKSPAVHARYQANDRAGLFADLSFPFAMLKPVGIDQMHFHRANTTTLLRMHAPEMYDDDLRQLRPMISLVNTTLQTQKGLELGRNGLPIRGAAPVIDQEGRHLGAVEVGSFVADDFLAALGNNRTKYRVFLKLGTQLSLFAASTGGGVDNLPDAELQRAFAGTAVMHQSTIDNRSYLTSAVPLRDYAGAPIGVVQISIDRTELTAGMQAMLYSFIAVAAVLGLVMAAFAAWVGWRMTQPYGTLIRSADGIAAGTQTSSVPMQDRRDELGRFARSLEGLRIARNDLARAKDEAQAASVAKATFLATMSHELRTPLNAVIGFADMLIMGLCEGRLKDGQLDYVRLIKQSASHLYDLLSDVLTLARFEAGAFPLSLETVDLAELVTSTGRMFEQQCAAADIGFELSMPALPPITADPTAVRQMLINLLSNAVKFTSAGGKIGVKIALVDGEVTMRVEDTGIGIPADKIETVLRPFEQVEGALSRKYGGAGLGLSIVNALVRLHGGRVLLHSEIGRGTVVELRWPAQLAAGTQDTAASAA